MNSAFASVFEYIYHGNPFDTFVAGTEQSQFTSNNAVTFSFITSTLIDYDTTFDLSSPNLVSWAITDGSFTYGAATAGAQLYPFPGTNFVTIDDNRNIVSWDFITQTFAIPSTPGSTIESCGAAPCPSSIGHIAEYAGKYDQITPLAAPFLYAGYAATPGCWTVPPAPVPLPSAIALLTSGLVGLGLLGWRRKRKAYKPVKVRRCKNASASASLA
jgi:hypothetical protein